MPLGIRGAGLAIVLGSVVDFSFFLYSLQYYLQLRVVSVAREVYLLPCALGGVLAGLTYFARPFVWSWLRMGLVLGALEIMFLLGGYAAGIFGETEKKALLGMLNAVGRVLARDHRADMIV